MILRELFQTNLDLKGDMRTVSENRISDSGEKLKNIENKKNMKK